MKNFFKKSYEYITSINFSNPFKTAQIEVQENEKNINIIDNKTLNKITIIVGSTNFYFIFNNQRETIPVLLLIRKENKIYENNVIEKIKGPKYIDKAMIFFDFLYYLDVKYQKSKDILINRNLLNNDLSYLNDNSLISFNYIYTSSFTEKKEEKNMFKSEININKDDNKDKNDGKPREEKKGDKIFPSIKNEQNATVPNDGNMKQQSFSSEDLLNLYIENLIREKFNNLKKEYFSLKLILPSYLNDEQKEKIKNIFQTKLEEKELKNNLNDEIIVKDEMIYFLENLNKNFENKIIFIHFGGSSLVVILYDYNTKTIIKKLEKLIGGIDIDIMLTKNCLTKFKNDNNGCSIFERSLIYKVKNKIEEEKKNFYLNNNNKLEINLENIQYNLTLKYEINKEDLIKNIKFIKEEFNNILIDILKNVNKDEIKNVIYTGNNFKLKIFEEVLYQHFSENICESIFDEKLSL